MPFVQYGSLAEGNGNPSVHSYYFFLTFLNFTDGVICPHLQSSETFSTEQVTSERPMWMRLQRKSAGDLLRCEGVSF